MEKSCLLTDKIKKSSINTAPNGRMPAIRLLRNMPRTMLVHCTVYNIILLVSYRLDKKNSKKIHI